MKLKLLGCACIDAASAWSGRRRLSGARIGLGAGDWRYLAWE
jgi:hypothetical protein